MNCLEWIRSMKHITACDEDVSAGIDQSFSCSQIYAAIDLDLRVQSFLENHLLQSFNLINRMFDERLSSKSWIHRHKQDHINILNDIFQE